MQIYILFFLYIFYLMHCNELCIVQDIQLELQ